MDESKEQGQGQDQASSSAAGSGYLVATGEGGALACRVGDQDFAEFTTPEGNGGEGDPCVPKTDES